MLEAPPVSDSNRRPSTGLVLDDGRIVEVTYDRSTHSTSFAIGTASSSAYVDSMRMPSGEVYVPISPSNGLIANKIVLLPSCAEDIESSETLAREIAAYLHRYVALSPDFELVAAHYVMLSWVYDAFQELPYLRFQGDFGTGKTRALLTIGSVCYKGVLASGASTVSPLFHILDAYRGTLILDEADFTFSDEKADLAKILNNGNVAGFSVLRTMQAPGGAYSPRAFHVYGPKIVAMRGAYEDRALESRFLTEQMDVVPRRESIALNLPLEQQAEALSLRNKLLSYRFRMRHRVSIDPSALASVSEPRLRQVLLPLFAVATGDESKAALLRLAEQAETRLKADRADSAAARLLAIYLDLLGEADVTRASVADVASRYRLLHSREHSTAVTNRWVGQVLRSQLHLKTRKSNGIYVLERASPEHLATLQRKYAVEPTK